MKTVRLSSEESDVLWKLDSSGQKAAPQNDSATYRCHGYFFGLALQRYDFLNRSQLFLIGCRSAWTAILLNNPIPL